VAYFNDKSYRLSEASRLFAIAEREFLQIDQERRRAADGSVPFTRLQEWQNASSVHVQRLRELDGLALTWHATYRLIVQCQAILRKQKETGSASKVALVTVGKIEDLEVVIEVGKRDEKEFELLDSITQSAEWFSSIDATVPNLKKMRYIDAMLKRNGQSTAFVEISEEDGLLIGNELSRFMFTQFGRENTAALMNGRKLLSDLGLEAEARLAAAIQEVKGKTWKRGLLLSKDASREDQLLSLGAGGESNGRLA
jgi:hypothetical protein